MTDSLTDLGAPVAIDHDDVVGSGDGSGSPPPTDEPAAEREPARVLGLTIEGWFTLVIVAGCSFFVLSQLGIGNLLSSSTPAGGDMGAHVWGPAYLRDHLLPEGRLTGWTPDWYDGFPAYTFYMVVPSLVIAFLSFVIPYGTAFKLVAVSGVVALPVCAWAFGRLNRLPFPIPPLLAVGMTAFLFDRSFSIYGGNIASTLAGEFAFSISLAFAVLYLGVLGRGLVDGKHRAWAAVLLALTALCHLIPAIFALAGTFVWFVLMLSWRRLRPTLAVALVVAAGAFALGIYSSSGVWQDEFRVGWVRFGVFWAIAALVLLVPAVMIADFPLQRLKYLATTLPVGVALAAFWAVPFYLNSRYMNDMGWEKKVNYGNFLFTRKNLDPQLVNAPKIQWVLALAALGALLAIVYGIFERRRGGVFWLGIALLSAFGFVVTPQIRLWNARLLPFYYLSLYLLAAVGVGYLIRTVAMLVAYDPRRPVRAVNLTGLSVAALAVFLVLAMPLRALGILGQTTKSGGYRFLFFETHDDSFVDSWAKWNFTGYEGKAAYPEYHDIIQTMADIGKEHGCGRAMWEHENQHDRYGTPMAMMLLPFWTDGCIGSQEGLYFEASGTTPYHFINQDELSSAPSNAQRDLPYTPGAPSRTDFDLGIQHLQMLGVKYYMAISDRMIDFGRRNENLTEIATSGPWVIFEIADSPMVTPLANQPAVVEGMSHNAETWLARSMDWYMDPSQWPVYLAGDGPESWQRISTDEAAAQTPVPQVEVSNVNAGTDTLSFDVSQPGTPILVKVSYFPNWKVSGAQGPYRVTPNLMVVVPTSTHVELHYGYTKVDALGWGLTALGLVGLVWLIRSGPLLMPHDDGPRDEIELEPGDEAAGGDGDGATDADSEVSASSGWPHAPPGTDGPPGPDPP